MMNRLRCLIPVCTWLIACSDSSQAMTGDQPLNQQAAGFGGLGPTAGTSRFVVPVSMVLGGRKAPATPTTTASPSTSGAAGVPASAGTPSGTAGTRAFPSGSFPGAGAFPGGSMPGGAPAASAGASAPADMPAAGSSGAVTAEPSATGDRATPEGVCARWKADRTDLSEGTWSGNVMTCDPGDMDPAARANALRVLNLYRWLADLPEITSDPTKDKEAQACALLQRANNSLSHMPPADWTCYMDEGAKAAGRCNISSGPAVGSVDGYMIDPGNPTTIGHRRWILSNSIGPTGIGGTDRHSCLMTTGNMRVNKAWQAWPAPGIIPVQALQQGFGQWVNTIDDTGWTVQSDTVNLSSAQVSVTSDDGMSLPVTVTQLSPGYGSRYAFRFNPMGWTTTPGTTYSINVTGGAQPIQYDVQVVDCK